MSAQGATTTAEEREEASRMRSAGEATPASAAAEPATAAFLRLPGAEIDENEIQKYVLIEAHSGSVSRLFVRGSASASYHKDVARPFLTDLHAAGAARHRVLGGGRIQHGSKKIQVYGFSYGFPWSGGVSRHADACAVLRERYPNHDVTWSDEGY